MQLVRYKKGKKMRVSYLREIFQKMRIWGVKKQNFKKKYEKKKKKRKEASGTSLRAETRLTVYRSLYIS